MKRNRRNILGAIACLMALAAGMSHAETAQERGLRIASDASDRNGGKDTTAAGEMILKTASGKTAEAPALALSAPAYAADDAASISGQFDAGYRYYFNDGQYDGQAEAGFYGFVGFQLNANLEGNGCHLLFLTIDKAANKQPLHADHDNHRWDHRKDRGRHDHRPIRHIVPRREHLFDAHDNRIHLWIGGDQQRPEVLVPAINEQNHKKRRDIRAAHRDHNIPEEPHGPRAINTSGLGQFIRNCQEKLAKQKGRRCRGDERKVHRSCSHAKACDNFEGRHNTDLNRQHESQENHPEKQHFPRKLEIDDGKAEAARSRSCHSNTYRHHKALNSIVAPARLRPKTMPWSNSEQTGHRQSGIGGFTIWAVSR
ncbi:hypothetical protein GQR58_029893 [Nymphon striatum]|nr:hypothetical protein GQR58_029893 [Nymphon striatum]